MIGAHSFTEGWSNITALGMRGGEGRLRRIKYELDSGVGVLYSYFSININIEVNISGYQNQYIYLF